MTGLGIRLYTDEDVDPALAEQLVGEGYDVLSCHAAGNHNKGLNDEWQLSFAASQGRSILVYNVADFLVLDRNWRANGRKHHGVILAEQLPNR